MEKTVDSWAEAADYAEGQLMGALQTMVEMMNDKDQASTARATVIKTFVDVAVKLHELRDSSAGDMELVGRLIEEFKSEFVEGSADLD